MAPKHRLYTPEIAQTILERLADGEALKAICRDEGMPTAGAVHYWVVTDHEGFADRYARAREVGLAMMADDTLAIADDGTNDTYLDDDGNKRTDYDVVARSKLRVDTRKWMLSKLMPKVYGDRVTQEHTGAEGGPIQIATTIDRPPTETREEWIARRQRELDQAKLLMGATAGSAD